MSIARTIAAWVSATATTAGPAEKATQAEVDAGTEASHIVDGETLRAADNLEGALIDTQVFTANGTWTKPAGTRMVEVECLGGGGGGGGADCSDSVSWAVGGGGAGGGYCRALFLASGWGATVSVVVGSGGAGGASTGGNGAAGGTSTFNGVSSPYCSASGGGAAGGTSTNNTVGSAGVGSFGTAAGFIGTSRRRDIGGGGNGGNVSSTWQGMWGGAGGGPFGGCTLMPQMQTNTGAYTGTAAPTSAHGVGGSGGLVKNSAGGAAGGAGKAGLVRVRSYS